MFLFTFVATNIGVQALTDKWLVYVPVIVEGAPLRKELLIHIAV